MGRSFFSKRSCVEIALSSDKLNISLLIFVLSLRKILIEESKSLYDKKLLSFSSPILNDGIGIPFLTIKNNFARLEIECSISSGGSRKIR